jgi:hypothetical protein
MLKIDMPFSACFVPHPGKVFKYVSKSGALYTGSIENQMAFEFMKIS